MDRLSSKKPTDVIILRGVSGDVEEAQILLHLKSFGFSPSYVRLIRDRISGVSKGIALVRFDSIETASSFQEKHPVTELGETLIWADFGFEHTNDDWTCLSCQSINFQTRKKCFSCGVFPPQKNAEETPTRPVNGEEDVSGLPTRYLLLRNLDPELTEKRIYEAVKIYESSLLRAWLVKSLETSNSCKFAFLEMNSVEDSVKFINRLQNFQIPFQIDNKSIDVSFGRDLDLLSQNGGPISYWDPRCCLLSFPEKPNNDKNSSVRSLFESQNRKKKVIGSASTITTSKPSKVLQLNLKRWTELAKNGIQTGEDSISDSCFVPASKELKSKFLDLNLHHCMLCDVKFHDKSEVLDHARNSPLHALKFEEYWQMATEYNPDGSEVYRDRAAERRDAFAEDVDEIRRKIAKSASIVEPDEPIKPSPVEDGIGAKLLKKMGWKEGKGLGKEETGIIEPVKATTLQQKGSGIGASEVVLADEISSDTSSSYQAYVKRSTRKRFKDQS